MIHEEALYQVYIPLPYINLRSRIGPTTSSATNTEIMFIGSCLNSTCVRHTSRQKKFKVWSKINIYIISIIIMRWYRQVRRVIKILKLTNKCFLAGNKTHRPINSAGLSTRSILTAKPRVPRQLQTPCRRQSGTVYCSETTSTRAICRWWYFVDRLSGYRWTTR